MSQEVSDVEAAEPDGSDSRHLGRRQLIKASAWAAPVIVLAAAVPAAAASGDTVTSAQVQLTADCGALRHGFTLKNASPTATITVSLAFAAEAWGLTKPGAKSNLISATNTANADYNPAVQGYSYQTVWGADSAITYTRATTGGGWNAERSGTAVFALAPGASGKLWQQNLNAFGEPRIIATVTQVKVGSTVVAAAAGSTARFSFGWGGACTAA